MSKEKYFQVGVKALIVNDKNQILLLYTGKRPSHYNSDYWDIPGGRIEEGETALSTLAREVKEEVGIDKLADVKLLQGVISNHEFDENELHFGLILMVYKVRIQPDSKIIITNEHDKYEWVTMKETAKRLANKYPPEFTDLLA